MRGPLRLAAALALGLAAGCFNDDFLLGAYCIDTVNCGSDQCCVGFRCRPYPADCVLTNDDAENPFPPAYERCETDEECLVHGLPRCVFWDGASAGFCADICIAIIEITCTEEDSDDLVPIPRTCITVDDQQVCALDCSDDGRCPSDMTCRTGVCVPTATQ